MSFEDLPVEETMRSFFQIPRIIFSDIFMRKYSAVLKINWIQALEYRANALVGVIALSQDFY